MNLFSRLNSGSRKPPAALLGLEVDGNRLYGVVVRRQNGALQLAQSFTAALTLDPLTNDPELVGREILNQLEAAGIRERHCAITVPLKWALTAHAEVPAMPEADTAKFLALEAERGFPCDVATLRVAVSRYTTPSGAGHATFVGIPGGHLERLEQALRAAKLKPVSFALGIGAVQPPPLEKGDGVLALVIGESQVGLQVACGGCVAALRTLDGVMETDAGVRLVNADLVERETRITLGQLAAECRAMVKCIRIFGPSELARELAREIGPQLRSLGMPVEVVEHYGADEFFAPVSPQTVPSGAFSLVARLLTGVPARFEFLPPKIPAWKQMAAQYASGKLRTICAVAAALAVLVAGAFGVQQWRLVRLNSQWTKMAATVGELQGIQEQIRQYRPWFDDSFRCLTILREVTLAFSEDGALTAKTVEIRDRNTVSCSGSARDNGALLRTLNQLRAVDGVHDVKVDQIRGKTPLQFSFEFQYGTEEAHEN